MVVYVCVCMFVFLVDCCVCALIAFAGLLDGSRGFGVWVCGS